MEPEPRSSAALPGLDHSLFSSFEVCVGDQHVPAPALAFLHPKDMGRLRREELHPPRTL